MQAERAGAKNVQKIMPCVGEQSQCTLHPTYCGFNRNKSKIKANGYYERIIQIPIYMRSVRMSMMFHIRCVFRFDVSFNSFFHCMGRKRQFAIAGANQLSSESYFSYLLYCQEFLSSIISKTSSSILSMPKRPIFPRFSIEWSMFCSAIPSV